MDWTHAATALGWLIILLQLPGGIAQGLRPLRDRVVDAIARRSGLDPSTERAIRQGRGRIDNDTLAGLKAVFDDPLCVETDPDLHRSHMHAVVRSNHLHLRLALKLRDRSCRTTTAFESVLVLART